jgi:hypothetical protein
VQPLGNLLHLGAEKPLAFNRAAWTFPRNDPEAILLNARQIIKTFVVENLALM